MLTPYVLSQEQTEDLNNNYNVANEYECVDDKGEPFYFMLYTHNKNHDVQIIKKSDNDDVIERYSLKNLKDDSKKIEDELEDSIKSDMEGYPYQEIIEKYESLVSERKHLQQPEKTQKKVSFFKKIFRF